MITADEKMQLELCELNTDNHDLMRSTLQGMIAQRHRIDEPEIVKTAALHGFFVSDLYMFIEGVRPFNSAVLLLHDGQTVPNWIYPTKNGSWSIREPEMVEGLRKCYHLHRFNGLFYNDSGVIGKDAVQKLISASLVPFFDVRIGAKVKSVFDLLCISATEEMPQLADNKVYCANGTTIVFDKDGTYKAIHEPDVFTVNRLPVVYDAKATCPTFDKYIRDLVEDYDLTMMLQFLGYLLIPSTKAQAALFLKGNGGEGKSQLGAVLMELFKGSAVTGSLSSLEENKFSLATLENKLLFLDDDLKTEKLKETATIKSVITATIPLTAERKGVDPHQFRSYARIMCFGNSHVDSLFDKSDGFYRRLLLPTCKQKARKADDRDFVKKLYAELPGIFNMMLTGLSSLIACDFNFTLSDACKQAIAEMKEAANPVHEFLTDDSWIDYDEQSSTWTTDIVAAFKRWCSLNEVEVPAGRTITLLLKQELKANGCKYDKHTKRSQDNCKERAAGYYGIKIKKYIY